MPTAVTTGKTKNSHVKDLLLLFAVPMGIVLFAAVVLYAPRFFARPEYDFIYTTCKASPCRNDYSVDAAGYIIKESPTSSGPNYYDHIAELRYYDASNDATKRLTMEDARQFRLNISSRSPDGYTLNRENSSNGFLFWSNYDEGWYLKNGAKKKRVDLTTSDLYYSPEIKLLGWVIK